jgi:flagellar hook-length control protein FliK
MQVGNILASIAPRAPLAGEPPPAEGGGGNFAQMLGRQQTAVPDAERAPSGDADASTATLPDDRAVQDRNVRSRTQAKPAARGAEPRRESDAAPGRTDEAAAKTEDPARDGEPAATDDAALRSWLATLHLPAHHDGAVPASPATAVVQSGAEPTGTTNPPELALDAAASSGASATTAATMPGAAGALRAGARDKGASLGALETTTGRDTAPSAETLAAGTAAKTAEASLAPIDTLAGARAAAPEAAAAPAESQPVASGPQDTPARAVPITTALDDPLFPRTFGVQVSVLARDGVQQAELHLNPAETGPVSVQIVMDGTQARIDFGADAAATRDRIEHSLPDLAAALREAGLTLTGGGVSQHAHGRGDSAGAPDPRPETTRVATDAEPTARAPTRLVSAGGIDLYA